MPMPGDDSWTHEEMVASARRHLLAELGLEGTDLATAFLSEAVTLRTRRGGVRAGLARLVGEIAVGTAPGLRYAGYEESHDAVVFHVPANLPVASGLHLPVLGEVRAPLARLAREASGGEVSAASPLLSVPTEVLRAGAEQFLRNPPTFPGWASVQQADIDRAFEADPPLLSDRRELFRRVKQASGYAADRQLLDRLAERNPGFLDYLQCFPVARTLKRRVIAWLGPTNSGKTHRAILELSQARSGMYLGPLRLLALEQRERLMELGQPCSLITGEERDLVSVTHSARTVEMADFSQRLDLCVLDEMQLAFDRDRGWAWVAAYCGVAADRLYVTGPVSTEAVIRKLAAVCGDEVEVHILERQGSLAFEGVLDWRHIPPRSAVIGFSRAMVLEMKAMFESRGLRVSTLYGGLTPEVRRNEARRFREGESDIVCATDAIGLGLNLPLERVIFYETDKFDGEVNRALDTAEILQIGGRAGRGPGATGWVAALSSRDARRVAHALARPQETPEPELLPAAPTGMHVRAIAEHLGHDRLQPILEFFRTRLTFPGGTFFPEVREAVFAAAEFVDLYAPHLPVEQRYTLACTPIDLEEHAFRNTVAEWLEALAAGREAKFPRSLESAEGLDGLEEMLQLVTLYRWLALKFPETFTELEHVEHLRRQGTEQTQAILRRSWGRHGLRRRECAHCGRAVLPSSPHRTCRECHQEGYA